MTTATPLADSTRNPEPAAQFQLAILGGCMSHQPGIPFNALYHRRVGRALQERTGIRLRPHVARGFGLDFGQRLDALQERSDLDGVLLHLRVMITKRARIVARVRTGDGSRWRIHPALFRRGHSGPAIEALREEENAGEEADAELEERLARQGRRRGKRLAGISLREVGSALGVAVRLDRWAADDEIHRLAGFVADCERRGLPVFILGPTPLLRQRWAGRSIDQLNHAIARFCDARGLPYALIAHDQDGSGNPILKGDGLHLTVEGHGYVAERLIESGFIDWAIRHSAESA